MSLIALYDTRRVKNVVKGNRGKECRDERVKKGFQKGKECGDERFIIPPSLFGITKPFIFAEIPYCELNEIKSKRFLKKFDKFKFVSEL